MKEPQQKVLLEISFPTKMSPDTKEHLNYLVKDELKRKGIWLDNECHGLVYKIIQ